MTPKLKAPALAVVSGVLYFVGFVGFDQWYLSWVCLVPVLVALEGLQTSKRAFWLSWLFGWVTHLGGYFWIVHLLQTFAYLPLPLAVLGWLLLCLAQGGQLAVWGWLTFQVRRRTGVPIGLVAPVTMMAVELLYPLLFPSYLANSQAWVSLPTQIADLGGPILVSAVIVLVNGALAELALALLAKRAPPVGVLARAALALALTLGYGAFRVRQMDARDAAAPKLKTAIIQANVGAGFKHQHADEGVRRFVSMTDAALNEPGVGLVVWPESGYNHIVYPSTRTLQGSVATDVKAPMIVGALRAGETPSGRKLFNTALALAPGGDIVGTYDKTVLLAFGEYVPGDKYLHGLYKKILPYTSSFGRGESLEPLPVGPYKLSTDICYEDILPEFIRTLMVPIDAEGHRPHAMVNVTNDSWYGPAEPPIHLALATFRAIEHRRWLVRSTATGISAFIDSSGRIVKKSGFETQETLWHDVPMITDGATVYGVVGDVFGWLGALATLLGWFWPKLRRPQVA